MDQKSFVSNETNDVEDEIDEKPTDYSLRFQVLNYINLEWFECFKKLTCFKFI